MLPIAIITTMAPGVLAGDDAGTGRAARLLNPSKNAVADIFGRLGSLV
jgi:hypothetical protein